MWWQKQPGKGLGPLGTTTLLRAPCWARSCSGLRETEHDTTSNSNTNKVPLDCGGAWGWEHPLFPAIAPGYSHNPAHFAPQVSKQQFHDEAVPSPRRLQCSRGACSVQADRKFSNPGSTLSISSSSGPCLKASSHYLWKGTRCVRYKYKSTKVPLKRYKCPYGHRGWALLQPCAGALAWHPSAARESPFQLGMTPGSPFHAK